MKILKLVFKSLTFFCKITLNLRKLLQYKCYSTHHKHNFCPLNFNYYFVQFLKLLNLIVGVDIDNKSCFEKHISLAKLIYYYSTQNFCNENFSIRCLLFIISFTASKLFINIYLLKYCVFSKIMFHYFIEQKFVT